MFSFVGCQLGFGRSRLEQAGHTLERLSFPVSDLLGVDAKLAAELGDCFVALQGFQNHFGFEASVVNAPN